MIVNILTVSEKEFKYNEETSTRFDDKDLKQSKTGNINYSKTDIGSDHISNTSDK